MGCCKSTLNDSSSDNSTRSNLDGVVPEANPEVGREINVTLPNGNIVNSRAYEIQTAGELKVDCLNQHAVNLENIEVVAVCENNQQIVLEDNQELAENLWRLHNILLRPRMPNDDLMNAIHLRQNPQQL
ncbi:uncharacterized protein LOC106073885 [Biomphalaria glabrata]|uniref:Uncharacterized protein LOC106073885 n=1 Tax=Biomphalaria glabrata TaxID=6526 RepID=A0A2C9KXP2_BIOGL|nr:uncharacterized protein LOC106073885 [Biomphalaria glabrata]XP_055866643.1 uncharacterized protein LOC106073885 [Biomphalaria glabrata]XP_055866645.1 uncharacterized protein LOC106073885 [Biomphalaria glabrata]KAI8779815.1 hypothetical protein BgiBS90_019009 [Biomphalaria glabrata]